MTRTPEEIEQYRQVCREIRHRLDSVKYAYDVWVTPHALPVADVEDLGSGDLLLVNAYGQDGRGDPVFAFVSDPTVHEWVSGDAGLWALGIQDQRPGGVNFTVTYPADTPAETIAKAFRGVVLLLTTYGDIKIEPPFARIGG